MSRAQPYQPALLRLLHGAMVLLVPLVAPADEGARGVD